MNTLLLRAEGTRVDGLDILGHALDAEPVGRTCPPGGAHALA